MTDAMPPSSSAQPVAQELLQQVRVINPIADASLPADSVVDVLIEGTTLKAIAPHIDPPAEAQITPAKGLILGPGLVDLYSTSGEPGFEERETLESLAQAALAGGFTRLSLLPTMEPVVDQSAVLQALKTHRSPVQLQYWGALTQTTQGKQMSELLELAEAGVVGFSDGQPTENLVLVQRLLEYLQPLNLPVALWPCDRQLTGEGVARDGSIALSLGLPGVPDMAETAMLSALIECVREVGTPVHLMRISTARSVALIERAKADGIPITASVSWLHLLCDSQDLSDYDPNLRLQPPLGNPQDREALTEAVQRGVIDAIAIDHSPFTYEEKTVPFGVAPPGSIGLELALPLLWQRFVASGQWSALELWTRLSNAPARCLNQSPPGLVVDKPLEMTLFDPQLRWTVAPEGLQSLAANTAWLGQDICGKVLKTYC